MVSNKLMLAILLCLVAASLVLAADKMPGVGRTYDLTLARPAIVGSVLLPAGEYRVQHLMEGEKHIMLFTGGKGKQARVECTMVKLESKAASDMAEYNIRPNGDRVLNTLIFKGEIYQHKF